MSGSTVGAVVGAAVGFVVSGFNPAGARWGWMIGSTVGGIVDPDVIQGPRLTDAQAQTSQEGVPRPIIYGTAVCAGNVIQVGPLVEHTHRERQGKGGPVQETYTYTRTYAIRVCEGPVGGIRRIWRNDKLVYDATAPEDRPDYMAADSWQAMLLQLTAQSASFASKLTIYLGDEAQLPDPTLEALPAANGGGVGNVPAYRGSCYVVIADDDLTELGGALPHYRFEVSKCGTTTPGETGGVIALLNADGNLTDPTGRVWTNHGATLASDPFRFGGGALQLNDSTAADHIRVESVLGDVVTTAARDYTIECWALVAPEWTGGANTAIFSALNTSDAAGGLDTGYLALLHLVAGGDYGTFVFRLDGVGDVSVAVPAKDVWYHLAVSRSGTTFRFFLDGQLVGTLTGDVRLLPGTTIGLGLQGGWAYSFWGSVDALRVVYGAALYTSNFPVPVTAPSLGDLPDAPGYFIGSDGEIVGPALPTVTACAPDLSEVIEDICERAGLAASQLDLADATDAVRGFLLGRQMSAADALRMLQVGYFGDFPEWDAQLHWVPRGGAVAVTLTDADLVESDDDEETRAQAVEFPRKLHLLAPDPDVAYEPTKQTAERRSSNVQAVGEATVELSISATRDESAQRADKMLKATWAAAEGRITRELPEEFSRLTPSDCFAYDGKRWRIERCEYLDGSVRIEAVRDRISAYTSGATGSPINTPAPPVSSLRGPTAFHAMNLPALTSSQTTPGMVIAMSGRIDGWQGAALQYSVDGGLTYITAFTTTVESTMGTLTAACLATGGMSVRTVHGHTLASVTAAQLALRANGFAVTTSGVSEVGQFQTATETVTDTYALTDCLRGQLGTTAASHATGDAWVLLDDAVTFLPLDISLAGRTIRFRPVSLGTVPENNPTYDVVFAPLFTAPTVVDFLETNTGAVITTDTGDYLQVISA